MIIEFKPEHYDQLIPNEFSDAPSFKEVMLSKDYYKYTMIDLETKVIKAIICFRNTHENVYAAFFMLSKCFSFREAKNLKEFMDHCIKVLKPSRVWTASLDNPLITRWHRFLRMKYERQIEFEDKVFNLWAIYGN